MKPYKIRLAHSNIMAFTLVLLYAGLFFCWVNYFYYLIDFRLAVLIFLLLCGLSVHGFRRWGTKALIHINKDAITVKRSLFGQKKTILLHRISIIRISQHMPKGYIANETLEILSKKGAVILRCHPKGQQEDYQTLFNALITAIKAKPTLRDYDSFSSRKVYDYVNRIYINTPIADRNDPIKQRNRMLLYSAIGLAVFCISILPHYERFLNQFITSSMYSVTRDGTYYRNNKLDANPVQFVYFDRTVGKDSVHVFCRGKIVEGVDVATFTGIEDFLYRDKNHVYTINPRMFPPSTKLEIINWVDAATFRRTGNRLFSDKNNEYRKYYKYPYIEAYK